jgi:hypothetical protein
MRVPRLHAQRARTALTPAAGAVDMRWTKGAARARLLLSNSHASEQPFIYGAPAPSRAGVRWLTREQ